MKKKTSKLKVVLFLVLLINITILYIFYQNKENRLVVINFFNEFFNKKQDIKPEVEKKVEVEDKIIDTTNWKIYKNDLYDFSVKYPEIWAEPQVEEINNENSEYQYQIKFGTEETLNGNENEGFFVFVSIKNNSNNTDVTKCDEDNNDQNQENLERKKVCQEPINYNNEDLFYKSKTAEDYANFHYYQFMKRDFEYKLVPILNNDSDPYLIGNNSLVEFRLVTDSFTIDFDSIQKKIKIEETKIAAAKAAAERARLARIAAAKAAAERAKLISRYPVQNTGAGRCAHGGKPSYSLTKNKHIDEDCCPDPDEWPNLRCRYSAKDYKIMLKGTPPSKLLK